MLIQMESGILTETSLMVWTIPKPIEDGRVLGGGL